MAPLNLPTFATDEEIDAALARAEMQADGPKATHARYESSLDAIVIDLVGGRRLLLPRKEVQGLESASESQIREIEIHGGVDIAWPQLDLDHYLPALIAGRYGSNEWMQSLDRAGLSDTPNNSSANIAKARAAHALYPLTAPFGHVDGQTLNRVSKLSVDGLFTGIILHFASGNVSISALADDSIAVALVDQPAPAVDVSAEAPWRTFIGAELGWNWFALNQQGYLDTVMVALQDVASPQLSFTAVASELKVCRVLPTSAV
jgi:hypothetical protein